MGHVQTQQQIELQAEALQIAGEQAQQQALAQVQTQQ